MATGVVILLFGEATKLSRYLTAHDKCYRATVRFGRSTDTLDADGRIVDEQVLAPDWPGPGALAEALAAEKTRTMQQPPAFSALKVDGRRAHRLSRSGEPVELSSRPVAVSQLDVVETGPHHVVLQLRVSKGYYVRALARDLGQRLGAPAHLSELRRTQSGAFTLSEAVAWPPASPPPLMPIEQAARRELPCAELTEPGTQLARNGRQLSRTDFASEPGPPHDRAGDLDLPAAWLAPDGRLVALGERRGADRYAVVRGFRS